MGGAERHEDDRDDLNGPMWIVKGAPGTAEYLAFYKGAVEKGWIFSDPRGAKGSPARPRRWPKCTGSWLASGGIPYETEFTDEDGRRRPDGRHDGQDGRHVDDDAPSSRSRPAPLAADLFAPPAGYKLKEQK